MSVTIEVICIAVGMAAVGFAFYKYGAPYLNGIFNKAKVQYVVSATPTVIPPDGSYVKGNGADNGLYLIKGGSKHILTLQQWEGLDYPTYIIIDATTLANYPTGTPLN